MNIITSKHEEKGLIADNLFGGKIIKSTTGNFYICGYNGTGHYWVNLTTGKISGDRSESISGTILVTGDSITLKPE